LRLLARDVGHSGAEKNTRGQHRDEWHDSIVGLRNRSVGRLAQLAGADGGRLASVAGAGRVGHS
jgi:hypothetical protein